MGKASKRKGSAFERKVAGLIIHAAGKPFTRKDCYRTPMSGGHPYAGESDMVISKELQAIFPFCVECKHYRDWRPEKLLSRVAQTHHWVAQVTKASKADKFSRAPLLIAAGNNTKLFCAAPLNVLPDYSSRLKATRTPCILFSVEDVVWRMMLLSELLSALSRKARKLRTKEATR